MKEPRRFFVDEGVYDDVLDMIKDEHQEQINKWGWQVHSLPEWLMYTTEELGELARAASEYLYRDGSIEEVMKEAIQVATLAAKIARMAKEHFDARTKENKTG